ncbi:MAG: hypothetical protein MUQ56_02655, partial [Thermoleophilia bacterium]|nr:hypothetical protein [Thermoleophilia bacterium]
MAVDLTKALFQSRTRAALLKAVLRDGVSDSLSGLARRTGRSQHAVAVEVRNLAAAGLVNVESVGGADVVRANRAHPALGPIVQLLAAADAWPPGHDVKEEARRLKLKSELGMVVELAADASGHTELKARVADLRDHRRKTDVFFAEPRDDHDRGVVVRASPPAARKWGFFVNVGEDSLRVALRKSLPRP